jgi:hypothetical protein
MQFYQISCASGINNAVTRHYVALHGKWLYEDQTPLCGDLSPVWIGSVSRLGRNPDNARNPSHKFAVMPNIVSLHIKKAIHKISQGLTVRWWRYQRRLFAVYLGGWRGGLAGPGKS